ncbi:hypothetical protein OEZ86_007226 [Tetradesmus obliquus]|nr:hypothetical protein OEZ86_007226 [Tetradesmus obliquus]
MGMQSAGSSASRGLRLALGHNCLSSGCGASSCSLCEHNQSRRCRSHLKAKYVSRDFLRANCGAALAVGLVDESGQCCAQHLPGLVLQVCVLDAKRYKELNPGNAPLGFDALSPCILDKALLRWEGGAEVAVVSLPMEFNKASLSELQCFSISGEHQSGKASSYRLLLWLQDQPDIDPLVSEAFVVVTTRARSAMKSAVPSVEEPVGRLEGIGEQAVATLKALGQQQEVASRLPPRLHCVEKVGQYCELLAAAKLDLKLERDLTTLFKKADWNKAAQHASTAVHPDFRPRVWC